MLALQEYEYKKVQREKLQLLQDKEIAAQTRIKIKKKKGLMLSMAFSVFIHDCESSKIYAFRKSVNVTHFPQINNRRLRFDCEKLLQ